MYLSTLYPYASFTKTIFRIERKKNEKKWKNVPFLQVEG